MTIALAQLGHSLFCIEIRLARTLVWDISHQSLNLHSNLQASCFEIDANRTWFACIPIKFSISSKTFSIAAGVMPGREPITPYYSACTAMHTIGVALAIALAMKDAATHQLRELEQDRCLILWLLRHRMERPNKAIIVGPTGFRAIT